MIKKKKGDSKPVQSYVSTTKKKMKYIKLNDEEYPEGCDENGYYYS